MTLEDDVESMLSEQSNQSMFRVKAGFGRDQGGAGDSTYRAHEDSVLGMEDDKGIVSESDDGGYLYQSENDRVLHQGDNKAEDELSDISENSQDDDSSDADPNNLNGSPKKTKKNKGEKGERKKRKKKKAEAELAKEQPPVQKDIAPKGETTDKKNPLVNAYKKLEDDKPKKSSKNEGAKVS